MNAKQYRQMLKDLDLSHIGAARLLTIEPRSSRRYADGAREVPGTVAILLRLMLAGKLTAADIEAAHR